MIDVLLYDRNTDERERMRESLSSSVAVLSDDRLECKSCQSAKQVKEYLQKDITLDLSMLEVADDADIELIRNVRGFREQADMMLIADSSISPMKYMNPDIRACSLLQRPYSEEEMQSSIREFVSFYYRKKEVENKLGMKYL